MYSTEVTLLKRIYVTNAIGVQIEQLQEKTIPLIKVEDIYANEFYQADSQGYKPTLRIRISTLSYEGEEELLYMDKKYTVIRTQTPVPDETILICERKIKNSDVEQTQSPS